MATATGPQPPPPHHHYVRQDEDTLQPHPLSNQPIFHKEDTLKLLTSYMGLSFALFIALLPSKIQSLVPSVQTQIRDLTMRLSQAEDLVRQMKQRRIEDSKANARVVEIFASHRNAWQAEEKRLLQQIDAAVDEVAEMRAKVEREREEWEERVRELEREVGEREEMIGFMSRCNGGGCGGGDGGEEEEEEESGGGSSGEEESGGGSGEVENGGDGECVNSNYYEEENQQDGFSVGGLSSDLLSSISKFWPETTSLWQDVQDEAIESNYETLESMYHMKHFIARRESPWKMDVESTGVSSKLKVLEQKLLNLEQVDKSDLSKVPALLRKQAKRYQTLAGKIDDLCGRMQATDPCEPTHGPEFRTQLQTEFLLEAFRLQQRASETGQKLMELQTEIGKSYYADEIGSQSKLSTRLSYNSIRNNFKEVQRNLEIWLARIIGDLEGILSRDGVSRARDCYVARYPFVQ